MMSSTLSMPDPMPAAGFRTYSPWRKLALLWVIGVLSISLSACQFGGDTMGLDVVGYNHTDHEIGWFTVGDGGGGYLGKHREGGFVCCISIPQKYNSDMNLIVRWGGVDMETQERIIKVQPYTPADGGMLAVHFLRSGEIKVFVTMLAPWHPDYPLKGEEAKL